MRSVIVGLSALLGLLDSQDNLTTDVAWVRLIIEYLAPLPLYLRHIIYGYSTPNDCNTRMMCRYILRCITTVVSNIAFIIFPAMFTQQRPPKSLDEHDLRMIIFS